MKPRLLFAPLLVALALAGCDAGRSDEPAQLVVETPELGAELAIGQPFRVVARISDDEPVSPSRVSLLQSNGDVIASVTVENPAASDVLVIDTVLLVPEGTDPIGNPEGSAFLDFTYGDGGSTALQVFLVDAP